MANEQSSRFLTLLQREYREYKNSLLWTPVITASILILVMLGSVVLANRISIIGSTMLDALMDEGGRGVNISVSLNEDTGDEVTVVQIPEVDPATGEVTENEIEIARIERNLEDSAEVIVLDEVLPDPPAPPVAPETYEVLPENTIPAEQWEFSREWTFNPDLGNGGSDADDEAEQDSHDLNVMLGVVHAILTLILFIVTCNYLLSTLYEDRKDRSILFWRSMPVSEWEIVLSKFAVAMVLAPMIYIAISFVLQFAYVLLMMMLVWRMDKDPFDVVLGNIDFTALMIDPISGWIMTALLIAPVYAWLLCASALARRSPFMMAVTPFVGLYIAEGLLFGTEVIGNAVQNHLPHVTDTQSVGFYVFGPDWTHLNLSSLAGGLIFTVIALAATVWLRQHRWELK